jgi:uncharacterized membrane protein
MSIDTISFSKTLYIKAPVNAVFGFWSDFRNFPDFIWLIERVSILDETRSRWVVKAPMGKKVEFDSQITKLVEDESIVWRSSHYAVDSQGEITFSDNDDETRVQLVFSYSIKLRWVHKLAKAMNRLGFPSVTFDEGLKRIKNKIEIIHTESSGTDAGDDVM